MAKVMSNPFVVSTVALPAWIPPLGTYGAVGLNVMADVDPCPAGGCSYSGVEGQDAVTADWNGGVYAEDAAPWGAAIQFGGGHAGYWGNEVYAFDFESQTWARLTEPTVNVGPGGCGFDAQGLYSDQTPAPPHVYDHERYVPAADMGNARGSYVLPILQAVGDCPPVSRWTAHFFDLDTRLWSTSTNEVPDNARGYGWAMTAYDTTRRVIWLLDEGVPSHVGKLDIAAKTWSSVPHGSSEYVSGNTDMVGGYCPKHDLCVFDTADGVIWLWDPAAGTLTQANTTGTPPGDSHGMEWCAHASVQKFYCYRYSGTTVATLTPPETDPKVNPWVWGSESFAPHGNPGEPAINDGPNPPNPCYNRFRWANKLKCFVWHGSRLARVNLFRPMGAI